MTREFTQFGIFIGAVLYGIYTSFQLRRIKTDTAQVNTAVNHVGPTGRPLTERMDRLIEDVHILQYQQDQATKERVHIIDAANDVKSRVERMEALWETTALAHKTMNSKLDDLYKVMPKRKGDSE